MLAVLHVLGLLLAGFAGTYLLPAMCAIVTQDGTLFVFVIGAAINLVVGLSLAFGFRRYRRELKPRDGFLLVTLAWVLMSVAATIPFMIHMPSLGFTDAFFEAMSGLTTTGATILDGLDTLAPSMNLWRHTLHWFGGLGIIVLAVAILPLLGVGGMQLYKAETPGPMKNEKLTPRITETAKALWGAYIVMTVVGIVALRMCDMSWLDAICHAFSAVALGGFSTRDASVGYFDSLAVEGVLTVLMLLSSLNFARHFLAARRLSLRPYFNDPEAKAIMLILGVSVAGIAALLTVTNTYPTFAESLQHAAFNVVSMATTTGFVSENFELWPFFAPVWMLFLSCVVCSTGSTGGGIKMFRTLLLARQATRELKLLVHPAAVAPIRIGGLVIPDRIAYSVLAFIFLYFMTIVVLSFALLLSGLDVLSAFSAVVASINCAGPGLGRVGPSTNFASLTDFQTWICTLAMLLGRLEIFSVLVLFTAAFWRK